MFFQKLSNDIKFDPQPDYFLLKGSWPPRGYHPPSSGLNKYVIGFNVPFSVYFSPSMSMHSAVKKEERRDAVINVIN